MRRPAEPPGSPDLHVYSLRTKMGARVAAFTDHHFHSYDTTTALRGHSDNTNPAATALENSKSCQKLSMHRSWRNGYRVWVPKFVLQRRARRWPLWASAPTPCSGGRNARQLAKLVLLDLPLRLLPAAVCVRCASHASVRCMHTITKTLALRWQPHVSLPAAEQLKCIQYER